MKQIWTGPMAQAAGKYGENAPMATVCCNACRTCATTNIIGLAPGGCGRIGVRRASPHAPSRHALLASAARNRHRRSLRRRDATRRPGLLRLVEELPPD